MIQSNIEVEKINYWYCFTESDDGVVFDAIFISYTTGRLPLYFKFKRFKNFCYHDSIRDFVIKYVSNIEYTSLLGWLNKNAHKLKINYGYADSDTKEVASITTSPR